MDDDPRNQLLMSVDPDAAVAEDERQSVVLDREKLHLFETGSGDAIVHSLSEHRRATTTGPESGAAGGD
jgi:multiple sugar transport system ATP-binding protein